MPENMRVIRVFIGSPGGLNDERQAAHAVVNSINKAHSERWGLFFKLMGWEDAVPGYVRPQSKINDDLDRCEYFMGVLWDHWGSTPSAESEGYSSGFEEEYRRAERNFLSGKMKDIALYFKKFDQPPGWDPGVSIKRVIDFKEECISEKKVFFKEFESVPDFKELVFEKLTEIGWNETALSQYVQASPAQTAVQLPVNNEQKAERRSLTLFGIGTNSFLTDLANRAGGWDEATPVDVARLRLISCSLSRSGNDEAVLGPHDANLCYLHLRDSDLPEQELDALIEAGLAAFQHQNVPLWHWMAKNSDGEQIWKRISFLAAVSSDQERKSALDVLSLSDQPIPEIEGLFDKKNTVEYWFSKDASEQSFESATDFISSNAEFDDVPMIELACEICSDARKKKVFAAVAAIIARRSVADALSYIVERDVDKVDGALVDAIFAKGENLETSKVLNALASKCDAIRAAAFKLLASRKAIDVDTAQALVTDNSHEVRLGAAIALHDLGSPLSEEVVKKALMAPRVGLGNAIYMGEGPNDKYFEYYRTHVASKLDFEYLRSEVYGDLVLNETYVSNLYQKFPKRVIGDIRRDIEDGYLKFFEASIKILEGRVGSDSPLIKDFRKLEDFSRGIMLGHALPALCRIMDRQDLALVRHVIDTFEPKAHADIIRYLRRFGDWSDLPRIINIGQTLRYIGSLVNASTVSMPSEKVSAILHLSAGRISDLLAMDIDIRLKVDIIKHIPSKVFSSLDHSMIASLIDHEDENIRIISSLKCVSCLSKKRVSEILNWYINRSSHRYYNTVHWLDLGASVHPRVALGVAKRFIGRL